MVTAEPVDPRDTRWEIDQPIYRVYFWSRQAPPPGIGVEQVGYVAEEYRIRGATDVTDVLDWAQRTARADQTYCLYVEHVADGLLGLIRLAGVDPGLSADQETVKLPGLH